MFGAQGPPKNSESHIDASLSRQPLVKGERLVRYEVNAVMLSLPLKDRRAFEKLYALPVPASQTPAATPPFGIAIHCVILRPWLEPVIGVPLSALKGLH